MSRLTRLFNIYKEQHGVVRLRHFALRDAQGTRVGHVDRCELGTDWVQVTGWTTTPRLSLEADGQIVTTAPSFARADVTTKLDLDAAQITGFNLRLDKVERPATLWVETGKDRRSYAIGGLSRGRDLRMTLRILGPFLRDAARAVPAALRWWRHRDKASVNRVLEIMRISTKPKLGKLDEGLFAPSQSAPQTRPETPPQSPPQSAPQTPPPETLLQTPVTIILPIYNALDLLPEVLDRVQRNTDLPYRLILVEDCSSDDRVRPWLRNWVDGLPPDTRARVDLLENATNLGFVGSVNRAFDAAIPLGHHVVLLNSDAFVPKAWASRLIRPMIERDEVATVTPFSNDAEIFTAPSICVHAELAPGAAEALDTVAQGFAWDKTCYEAPTGVGFCMALNIDYLRQIPGFDTAFGRGYGEEVDWCQKARALGGRNMGLAGLYVEHRGGQSFGSVEKLDRIRHASNLVTYRYPKYDEDVRRFVRDDPLVTPRLALGIAWAASHAQDRVPVYLAHDMGGGADQYLQTRIAEGLARDETAIVLRVGGMTRWQVELHTPAGMTCGSSESTAFVSALIGLLPARRIVYSCGVGHPEPLELPAILRDLAKGDAHRLEVLFHDFFALSPSYTLLNNEGDFEGVPDVETRDPAHLHKTGDGTLVPLAAWRQAWGALLNEADSITVFSENSREIVAAAYPACAPTLQVQPHEMAHTVPAIPPGRRSDGRPVIGILGSIGHAKGVGVLADLSRYLKSSRRARLVVLGTIDTRYPLASSATVHGRYRPEEIPALVARYGISRWFVPSICPETFSYTTHECIATGLPVFSFALGAQGDAVAKARDSGGAGGTIALGVSPKALADHLLRDA